VKIEAAVVVVDAADISLEAGEFINVQFSIVICHLWKESSVPFRSDEN
jgi:hypothetical protein